MGEVRGQLTVFFEERFWVGVFERTEDGKVSASKVTFGAEPKDGEVYEYILKHYGELRFSPAVAADAAPKTPNPKKLQREISRSLEGAGVGTRSQQALQLQREQNKLERKTVSREAKLAREERLFELKQQKKKEKHRGR